MLLTLYRFHFTQSLVFGPEIEKATPNRVVMPKRIIVEASEWLEGEPLEGVRNNSQAENMEA